MGTTTTMPTSKNKRKSKAGQTRKAKNEKRRADLRPGSPMGGPRLSDQVAGLIAPDPARPRLSDER